MTKPVMRRARRSALLTLALCLSFVFTTSCATMHCMTGDDDADSRWIGTWSTAIQPINENDNTRPPDPPGLGDTTLRQIVHVSTGGDTIRIRFSDFYAEWGNWGVTINEATVAVSEGEDKIDTSTIIPITFNGGEASVTVPRGSIVISDPIEMIVPPLSDLAITIHLEDDSRVISGHRGARCTTYLAAGNHVNEPNLPDPATCTAWYYLSGVDVLKNSKAAAVAVIGDSITDGKGSTTDGNGRWPDYLARRLQAQSGMQDIGVLNYGNGGGSLLRGGIGDTVMTRLDKDVLAQPGVEWVIVAIGVNDLAGLRGEPDDLIRAFKQLVLRAKDRGLKVYGCTIMPAPNYLRQENQKSARLEINEWMRTSAAFDAVIDMDAALRDPEDPTKLRDEADSGDHLHLNDTGHSLMADAVDLDLFLR